MDLVEPLEPERGRAARGAAAVGVLSLIGFTLATLGLLEAVGGLARFQELVTRAGPAAPLAYILLKAITTVLAPLSGTPLRVTSGALFGLWQGVLYTLIADVLGGSISFWISRLYGRRFLRWFIGSRAVTSLDDLSQHTGGWRALLFVRLVIPAIYNYVSYAAGLTNLPFRQYAAVTALGGVIPTSFVVAIGAGITADPTTLVLTYGALVVVAVAVLLGRRQVLSRRDSRPSLDDSWPDRKEDPDSRLS